LFIATPPATVSAPPLTILDAFCVSPIDRPPINTKLAETEDVLGVVSLKL